MNQFSEAVLTSLDFEAAQSASMRGRRIRFHRLRKYAYRLLDHVRTGMLVYHQILSQTD